MSDQSRSPLRIGFRVGVFPKLSETFVLNQINALMDRGHDVSILAEERPETLDPSLAQDTEAARARTRYLKAENELKRTLSSALPYRIRRAMEAREERRLLSECDVVVCNFGWFGARMFEATDDPSEHAKLVTILHGDDMSRHLSGGNEHAYDGLVKSGGLLLSVNEIWKARLKARGAPDHLNLIHHLGVDPSKFEFVDRDCAKDEPTVLTIVCRMVEKKGLAYALQALHQVRTSRPDLRFEFRLYGDGPLRAELVALAEELGIDDCVHFKGSIPNAEVRTAFANADVFLHPSVTADDGDMEGLPISMMEAMATGLPVIATHHSGIPELVRHGENGLLSPERDASHLAAQLIQIIADPEARQAMGQAARNTIETEFALSTSIDRLEDFLYRLVDGKFHPETTFPQPEAAE